MNPNVGSVRLVDRRTRVVEVLGPALPGSRWATDLQLSFDHRQAGLREYMAGPQPVGLCFQASARAARFLVNEGPLGDALLDLPASRPRTPVRLAQPYGPRGWLVEA
jgi:hypothetical protein